MAYRPLTTTSACGDEVLRSNSFSLFVSSKGDVYSIGIHTQGAHGHEKRVRTPTMISSLTNVISVGCGTKHSVCLDSDGNVFTFGSNYFGHLGIGVDRDTLEFTHIPQKVNLPPCKEISCGDDFTVCLSEDRFLYSFGCNINGQLGFGNAGSYNSPHKIFSLQDVEFIECGRDHAFCKTLNNEIFCWGNNNYGQLGLGNYNIQNTPILCSSLSNEDIVDIKCASWYTLVLTSNQHVLSCGNNGCGQIGRKLDNGYSSPSFQKIEELSEIIRIECGGDHSMCIDINNDLYVFGNNMFTQLGLGDRNSIYIPFKHPSLSNIIDISKGGYYTFVKTSNNEIYAFRRRSLEITDKLPFRIFEDNEDIWCGSTGKSKAKSARSILPRIKEKEDNSPPKKKQKIK